jgi:hypothetical protein
MFRKITAAITVLTTIATPVVAQAQVSPAEQFMTDYSNQMMRMGYGDYVRISATRAINFAHSACNALDAGTSFEEIGRIMDQTVQNDDEANRRFFYSMSGTAFVLGVTYFCPQHIDALRDAAARWNAQNSGRSNPTPVGRSGNPLD